MADNFITVEELDKKPVEEQQIEFVERKGLGHPDYIIDSACEAASISLSKHYLQRFGRILHHNLDKGLLVGGRAVNRFGYGRIEEPITIIVAGRASKTIRTSTGESIIPVDDIVVDAIKSMIRSNFRFLDPEKHVSIETRIRESSPDLKSVVESQTAVPLANDTSFGVSFYPLTPLERIVYETERRLNSSEFKSRVRESGEDVKVMGLRREKNVIITVADGIVSTLTRDRDHYHSVKEQIRDEVERLVGRVAPDYSVKVYVNTADKYGVHVGDEVFYLTCTGTSAEHGDDGNTGRGNRANGLITPNRQMSLEAAAGKNPISHVGKIYNILARLMAERIYHETKMVKEVYVRLLSQIGKPIDQPLSASIQAIPVGSLTSNLINEIKNIMDDEFSKVTRITQMVLSGEVTVF